MYPNQAAIIQDVKQEVLTELQKEGYANSPYPASHLNSPGHMNYQHGSAYNPYATDQMYQTIKESVKDEILAQVGMQQADQLARAYGIDNTLSDRRLQQMIDARYRLVDNKRRMLKKSSKLFTGWKPEDLLIHI